LRVSWNQSRHVTRFPVQLWKYWGRGEGVGVRRSPREEAQANSQEELRCRGEPERHRRGAVAQRSREKTQG